MSDGIAYQNKDIEFKMLSESFKERSFEAYGLKLPRIKEVLPTNLPAVLANELRVDNLFRLEDDTLALVDYEAEDKVSNRIKYVNYIGRIMKRYYEGCHEIPDIRMIVIYTGDVRKAEAVFETKSMTLRMEQVFVRDLPAEQIYQTVIHKLKNGDKLTEKELMQLIILPLAEQGADNKQKRIEQVIELAGQIENEQEQKLVFSGLLVITDKFISKENAKSIRRKLTMTKVFQMIVDEVEEENRQKEKERNRKNAEKLLRGGVDIDIIIDVTELTEDEVREIEKNMLVAQ